MARDKPTTHYSALQIRFWNLLDGDSIGELLDREDTALEPERKNCQIRVSRLPYWMIAGAAAVCRSKIRPYTGQWYYRRIIALELSLRLPSHLA
jgi:hypothetical protein